MKWLNKCIFCLSTNIIYCLCCEGGKSDDYRGGYLFPVQVLNEEELAELQKISPEMFEKNSEKINKNEKSEDYSK